MRLPFTSRRRAQAAVVVATVGLRHRLDKADADLRSEQATRRALEAELVAAREKRPVVKVEHPDELWSLIDWSLWGSGMGDVFREQLADQFIAALTPEQHTQALELIRWWTEDRGREPLGRRRYEDQQRRLRRALRAVATLRAEAAVQRRVVDRMTDQLLDATGHIGEPLVAAARVTLGLDKEDAA